MRGINNLSFVNITRLTEQENGNEGIKCQWEMTPAIVDR